MNAYTPMQTLAKIHRQLWWLIRLTGSVEVQFGPESASFADLCEVEKVMRATVEEVRKIMSREHANAVNQGNLRQARDFSLKAKIAKATGDSLHAAASIPSGPSHK